MKVLILFSILFSLQVKAQESLKIERDPQLELYIEVNSFLVNGLGYTDVTETYSSLKRRERDQALEYFNRFESCDDPHLNSLALIAYSKSAYGRLETVEQQPAIRNRDFFKAYYAKCPYALMLNKNNAPFKTYIEGDDLFSFDQLDHVLKCNRATLFLLGARLNKIQRETYDQYVRDNGLRYKSDASQRFIKRNKRYRQVRQRVKEKCGLLLINEQIKSDIYNGSIDALIEDVRREKSDQ